MSHLGYISAAIFIFLVWDLEISPLCLFYCLSQIEKRNWGMKPTIFLWIPDTSCSFVSMSVFFCLFFISIFWPHCTACRIEPVPPAAEAQSPNPWTTRGSLWLRFIYVTVWRACWVPSLLCALRLLGFFFFTQAWLLIFGQRLIGKLINLHTVEPLNHKYLGKWTCGDVCEERFLVSQLFSHPTDAVWEEACQRLEPAHDGSIQTSLKKY